MSNKADGLSNRAKRLKVLHIIPSVAPCRGGPSKAVIEMVAALRRLDIDAEIATTNDDGPTELGAEHGIELNKLIDYQGAPVRFFQRYSPRVSAVREFAYSASFKVWLAKHIQDYDLVHVHAVFSYCSSYAMRLARKNKIPYIVRPIGQLEGWSLAQSKLKKALYLRVLEKANIEAAHAVHFTAKSERDQALQRFAKLTPSVIPLGIDMPKPIRNAAQIAFEHWQIDLQAPCLVYLSRLHTKKGLEHLLQALATLQHADLRLIIAGDGEPDYLLQLKALVKSLELEQQCQFIGFVEGEQKEGLLQRADLFCLTSHSENFGIAVLEAMANGTAPLISKQVALANEVSEHKLGFICDLSQQDISAKLNIALSDPEQTRDTGRKAREFVAQHYQWAAIAEKLSDLYQRVVN